MSDAVPRHGSRQVVPRALYVLLRGAIDHAGTFPPSTLTLEDAVRSYVTGVHGPYGWMLGRFVVSAPHWRQVDAMLAGLEPPPSRCSLTLILDADRADELSMVNQVAVTGSRVESLELRPMSPAAIPRIAAQLPPELTIYCEVPPVRNQEWLIAIARAGWRAKIRTGGITLDAFPSVQQLASFIADCIESGIAFKATAGLHHPVRAVYPLTYEADPPRGPMHGFLNLLLGAALFSRGLSRQGLLEVLDERRPESFAFSDHQGGWRGHSVSTAELERVRANVVTTVGSCSYLEPVADLEAIGLLRHDEPGDG